MSAPALLAALPLLVGVAAGALGHLPLRLAFVVLAAAWLAAALSLFTGRGRVLTAAAACGCLSAGVAIGGGAARPGGKPPPLPRVPGAPPPPPGRAAGGPCGEARRPPVR